MCSVRGTCFISCSFLTSTCAYFYVIQCQILRPSLYGAQHPIVIMCNEDSKYGRQLRKYVVVGRCCESGDILTPAPGDSVAIEDRFLMKAEIGICIEVAHRYESKHHSRPSSCRGFSA